MILLGLATASALLAGIPAALFSANLRRYAPPQLRPPGAAVPEVSVLIPARNEEQSIGSAVEPDGLARAVGFLEASRAALVSGIPRQETGTLLEKLLIPLIHFILLGFLPIGRMRSSLKPAYGAGCGQLFLARREAYEAAGGHAAIRDSMHDGLTLPRAFRSAGFATDLFDATDVAVCRMYRAAGEVWRGLAKNATEGLGAPETILPATVLLAFGQILPPVLLAAGWIRGEFTTLVPMAAGASVLAWCPRLLGIRRFRQSVLGALLHPVGVALLLAIQWTALARTLLGRPSGWKGRNNSGI